jgi:hypothetical protein
MREMDEICMTMGQIMSKVFNLYDIEETQNVRNLLALLVHLSVKEADEPHNTLDNSICDDFCGYCDIHENYCRCPEHGKYGGRISRDYDDEED